MKGRANIIIVAFLFGMGIGLLLVYLGWQIYKGNTKYYQLLYGQVLGKKNKDNYISKNHKRFGILYIMLGIIVDAIILWFQFN